MKLKNFLTLKVGSGILLSGNVYNPYINYSWSQTITVGGNQQIKDTGTAGLNLQQFFGQGVWFNGVDNSISIESVPVSNNMSLAYNFVPAANSRIFGRSTWDTFIGFSTISATEGVVRCRFTGTDTVFTSRLTLGVPYNITLVLKPDVIDLWVNGILRESVSHTYTFAHPLEFIGRNSTAFANCVIKDIYVYNKHLTQAEIKNYNNNPNQFFMDSLEDSSCVLAMPMCEKDGFVRNYKSYSEGSNLVVGSNFENPTLWGIGDSTTTNIGGNAVNFNNTTSFVSHIPFLSIFNTPSTVGKYFIVELEVFNYQSGSVRVEIGASVANSNATPFLMSKGKHQFVVQHTTNSTNRPVIRTISFTGSVTNLKIKELTSIYPITNYLATCRTNAQRLPYGLQTSGFKRDNLGRILSKSDFLEADGVGYGNTGWIASSNTPLSIEMIVYYDGGLLNGRHGATNNVYGNQDIKRWFYSLMGAYYSEAIGGTARHINIVVTFDGINTFNFYRDGVFKDVQVITPLSVTLPFYIGMQNGLSSQVATQGVRLFKVHQKALTQDEITKSFNKYQSQGLLDE